MKKFIAAMVIFGLLGMGYLKLRDTKLEFSALRGEIKEVGRGDITLPITALGDVAPASRHEIKSEASGEVVDILHHPGDVVKRGDLLIRLKKDDEQRSVNRAGDDVKRTKANLEKARIALRSAETARIDLTRSRIARINAQLEMAKFNLDKIEALDKERRASAEELLRFRTTHAELSAQRVGAEADLEDSKLAAERARQEVILAQASHDQALTVLADAQERLDETDITSPVDGMVVLINTQLGEVIQGGKTTLTGGTVLAVVADCSKLYVRADVDEADIGQVRELAPEWARPGAKRRTVDPSTADPGTPVKITVDAFHEEEFEGVIERIHPEPRSRAASVVTYRVDILLTSDNRNKLLLGMQADVEFTADSVTDVVRVPHEAIYKNEFEKLGVYLAVRDPNTGALESKFQPCRFGLDDGIFAQVVEGVEQGARVYVKLPQKTQRERDAEKK